MTKLSKKEKYLVIGALVFASVALFIYFYYFPLKDEIKELERQSEEVSLELDEAKSLVVKIENTKKEIENLEIEAAENMAILMENIDEPEILDYISNVTNYADGSSDISDLTAMSYDSVSNHDLYYSKGISLSFNSNYNSLKEILKAFEAGDKYASLTTMNITSLEKDDSSAANQGEGSEETTGAVSTSGYPLKVECGLSFYGETPLWDSSGEYIFMEGGNFSKTDLFK